MSFGRPPSISTGFSPSPPVRFVLTALCSTAEQVNVVRLEGPRFLSSGPLWYVRVICPTPDAHHPFAGECKEYMKVYLDCLRKNGSNSTPCRILNRDYLDCRMNKYVFCRVPTLLRCESHSTVGALWTAMNGGTWG
jgi:hypothetical protein